MKSKAKIRGRIVKPEAGQPPPVEQADPLVWLVSRLQVDEENQPLMQGIFSNYNDDIIIEADPNTLVGRAPGVRGPAQRLEIGDGLRVEDGVLIGEGGGEKGDPGPPGPTGPPGPEGPSGASTTRFFYRFDATSQAVNDPGAGRFRYNNSAPSQVTMFIMDSQTQEGFDPTIMFTAATFDDEFIVQDKDIAASHQVWRLLGPANPLPDFFTVPVQLVSQQGSTNWFNNQEVAIILRVRGQPGPPGPQGPQGQQGEIGPRGPQGLTGAQGSQGPVGPIGPKGDQGDEGQQGIVGPQGIQGETGPKGETGNVGPKGDQGDQGVIGPTGNTGAQGPQGIQGEKGDPGSLGADEAPTDGKTYGRKNASWAEIISDVTKAYVDAEIAKMVPKIGGTMTGDLSVTSANPSVIVSRNAAGAFQAAFAGQVAGQYRWRILPGDSIAEGVGNTGSPFAIQRWSNTGTYLGTPLIIDRADGRVILEVDPNQPFGAATKGYADTKLSLAGGTMTGVVALVANSTIPNAGYATTQIANTDYVEVRGSAWGAAHSANKLPLSGGTITGTLTVNSTLQTLGNAWAHGGVVYLSNTGGHYLQMSGGVYNVGGQTIYHTGNLNPAAYLPTGGGTVGKLTATGGVWTTVAYGGSAGAIEVQGTGGGADAMLSFHRPGAFACNFGLTATDGHFAYGGWSHGGQVYRVYSEAQGLMAAMMNQIAGAVAAAKVPETRSSLRNMKEELRELLMLVKEHFEEGALKEERQWRKPNGRPFSE